jgi:serine/threonine protein kinase
LGQVFARKVIPLSSEFSKSTVINEVRAITKLCEVVVHQNLVKVLQHGWMTLGMQHGWLPTGEKYFIDMELCDLDLYNYIYQTVQWTTICSRERSTYFVATMSTDRRFRNIWSIMEQATRGVAFIHKQGEVHRDLKPTNSNIPSYGLK